MVPFKPPASDVPRPFEAQKSPAANKSQTGLNGDELLKVAYFLEQQDFFSEAALSFEQQDFLSFEQLSAQEAASLGAAAGPQPPQPAVAVAAAKTMSTGMSNVFIEDMV